MRSGWAAIIFMLVIIVLMGSLQPAVSTYTEETPPSLSVLEAYQTLNQLAHAPSPGKRGDIEKEGLDESGHPLSGIDPRTFYVRYWQKAFQDRNPEIHRAVIDQIDQIEAERMPREGAVPVLLQAARWYFYEELMARLDQETLPALKNDIEGDAESTVKPVMELYNEVFKPMARQLEPSFESHTVGTLHAVILPGLNNAAQTGSLRKFHIFREMMDKALVKMFLMALFKHTEQIEELYGQGDIKQAKVRLMEAQLNLRPIRGMLERTDSGAAAEATDSALVRSIADLYTDAYGLRLKPKTVENRLASALTKQIHAHIRQTVEHAEEGRKSKTLQGAAKISALSDLLELFAENRPTIDPFDRVENESELLLAALQANRFGQARERGFELLKQITWINGIYGEWDAKVVRMNGVEVETRIPVFPGGSADESRTLAAIRRVTEGLGGTVRYQSDANRMQLHYHGRKIQLTLGDNVKHAIVYIDGAEPKKVPIDPIQRIENRTFLTVNDLSALLGFVYTRNDQGIVLH